MSPRAEDIRVEWARDVEHADPQPTEGTSVTLHPPHPSGAARRRQKVKQSKKRCQTKKRRRRRKPKLDIPSQQAVTNPTTISSGLQPSPISQPKDVPASLLQQVFVDPFVALGEGAVWEFKTLLQTFGRRFSNISQDPVVQGLSGHPFTMGGAVVEATIDAAWASLIEQSARDFRSSNPEWWGDTFSIGRGLLGLRALGDFLSNGQFWQGLVGYNPETMTRTMPSDPKVWQEIGGAGVNLYQAGEKLGQPSGSVDQPSDSQLDRMRRP